MSTLVKNLRNNRTVVFDTGRFDNWCVFLVENNGYRIAPLDKIYFEELYHISKKYPTNKVYSDFVSIYHITTKNIDSKALILIDEIVETYKAVDKITVEQWFAVIYAGMIAEENKEKAILKKRVKRLGMYQVLVLACPADEAAIFSKGKKWKELDALMKAYGF